MTKIIDNEKVIEAFSRRFATKKFDATKVIPEKDFDTILEAGRLSPSSFGLEAWRFVVITNKEIRAEIGKMASGLGSKANEASHVVIYLSATESNVNGANDVKDGLFYKHMSNRFKLPDDKIEVMNSLRKIWQPNFDKILTEEWTSKQTYIALGNMMTAAAFLGIDSCPVEGFDKKDLDQYLQTKLNIDTTKYRSSVIAAFGYRDMEQPAKLRYSTEELVTWVK